MKIRLTQNFKDSFLYSTGNYLFQISSLITNVLVNRILGPSMAGVITFVTSIDQNVDMLYRPLRSSLERELPKLRQENLNEAKEFEQSVFFYNYIFILVGSLVFTIFLIISSNYYIRIACSFFIIINVFKALSFLYRIYLKSLSQFYFIAIALTVISIIQPFSTYYLAKYFQLSGFYVSRIFLFALTCFIMFLFIKDYPKYVSNFNIKIFGKIFMIGFPLVAYSIITTLLTTIDSFFIKQYLTLQELGYYGIGIMIVHAFLLFPDSIYGSYFPKFIVKEGYQHHNVMLLTHIVRILVIFLIAVCFFSIPVFIKLVLPDFEPSILICKILLLAFYFASIHQMFYYNLVRLKKVRYVNFFTVILLVILLPVYYIIIDLFKSIEAVAFVTVISFFIRTSINIIICMSIQKEKLSTQISTITGNLIYLIPILWLLVYDMIYHDYNIFNELIKAGGFIILFLPFAVKTLKNKEIKAVVLKKQ